MSNNIKNVIGRTVIDSRGNPTVEAEVVLENGITGRGISPSGASTGKFEAAELRDGDKKRYGGMGVSNAVGNVNGVIREALIGTDPTDIYGADRLMLEADGTPNKSKLGANAILAASLAVADAGARSLGVPLYRFIGGAAANVLPVPMMNILNGGAHAANTVDIQEFMIMPVGASSFDEGLMWCTEVFHALRAILKGKNLATSVGDEGGFAPNLASDEEAVAYIQEAVKSAGFKAGKDFVFALDAAASEWKGGKKGEYRYPKAGKTVTTAELIDRWKSLTEKYPIYSLEDGLDEDDWEGWQKLTEVLGDRVRLVGDDFFVTNVARIKRGIELKCANAVLIKPNQIGTVSETVEAVKLAQRYGYKCIASHRSGDSEDTFISDLAVGLNAGQIKTGAPNRSERVAKYNRLLRIESELGDSAEYLGIKALDII